MNHYSPKFQQNLTTGSKSGALLVERPSYTLLQNLRHQKHKILNLKDHLPKNFEGRGLKRKYFDNTYKNDKNSFIYLFFIYSPGKSLNTVLFTAKTANNINMHISSYGKNITKKY